MKNREIARIFSDIAGILEIQAGNPFKIRAYRTAAVNVERLPQSIEELSHKELLAIPGVGTDLAAKIEEYLQTGRMQAYEDLKLQVPAGLHSLLAIPDLGPKTAKLLYETHGIATIEELEQAAAEHRLAGTRGIQRKTEENILRGIASLKRGRERQPLGRMLPAALALVEELQKRASVERIEIAGSLRRGKDTIRDIDIVATAGDAARVMEVFVRLPQVEAVMMQGPTRSSVTITQGVQVDLRVVEPQSFGAALAYLTGSKPHNVRLREMALKRGMRLNEYGIFDENARRIGGAEEEEVYRLLQLPFIAPQLREDQGEIEAAQAGTLPQLITLSDLRGDLHMHTNWSDGAHSIQELVDAALKRGWSYLAITDHSEGVTAPTPGVSVERMKEQRKEILALNRSRKDFAVLYGIEAEIRQDGTLDLPDRILSELDFVVASMHTGFELSKAENTARLVAAMRNRWVCLIAHPTGRLIGEREPYEVDMEEVLRVAKETGTALEINSSPLRLDLNDRYARRAKELGVPVAVNSDTHTLGRVDSLTFGISTAQRGWLEKGDVLNAWDLPQLLQWLRRKRERSG